MDSKGVIANLEVFRSAIEQVDSSIVITDANGVIEYVNKYFIKTTGFTKDEVIGTTPWLFASDSHSKNTYRKLWHTINSGKTWNGELQNRRKEGSLVWEKVSISPVKDEEGTITNFIAIAQIIQNKKKAELELERSERLLNDVEKIHKTGGWEYDLKTGKSYWTNELYRLHGLEIDPDLNFIDIGLSCIHPEDRNKIEKAFNNAVETGEGYDLTLRFEDKKGVKKWCRFKAKPLLDKDNKYTKLVGTVVDVTDQKIKEKELKNITTRLEYALLGTQAGMWDWNVKTGDVIFDERWAGMLGYTLEELKPLSLETWKNLTHPDDMKIALVELENCFSGEKPIYECNMRMKHKNGDWIWINDRGAVFERDPKGEAVRMVGTHVDISEAMKDRKKLEVSEKRYRTLFEKSSYANLLEKDGIIIDCNTATVKLLGFDSKEEVIGLKIADVSPKTYKGRPAGDFIEFNKKRAKELGYHRFEWEHFKKDGSAFPVEIMLIYLDDDEYKDTRYVIWRDLSKRKQAEEALLKSNEERGILLGEIHHRVKNNLAIISGLMQLQVMNSSQKSELDLLNNSVNRINSIALIHEQLYQSDNFSDISLVENIEKQARSLKNMYSTEQGKQIETKLDLSDVTVNINQALPVGLLINEILNNSYKYAFQGLDKGEIFIKIREDNNKVKLIIGDNGVGMQVKDLENADSLGLTLIKTFLQQLEADVKITSKNGVKYKISFAKSSSNGIGSSKNFR